MKLEEKRLLDVKELAEYTGLGLTMAREFGKETGAVYRIGRRVLYDRHIIDRAIDNKALRFDVDKNKEETK